MRDTGKEKRPERQACITVLISTFFFSYHCKRPLTPMHDFTWQLSVHSEP